MSEATTQERTPRASNLDKASLDKANLDKASLDEARDGPGDSQGDIQEQSSEAQPNEASSLSVSDPDSSFESSLDPSLDPSLDSSRDASFDSAPPPVIRRLSQKVINRIAAGEVLERPSAAVKELVENALDAQASKIRISIRHGGKSLLRVQDDGCGMDKKSLLLAVERHATSKLPKDDLLDIHTFGFRGEALAAIASVSRTLIKSCTKAGDAAEIFVEAGKVSEPKSSVQPQGTDIQVQDLFFATPARLRFLRSDPYETALVLAQIERIALANPYVQFECFDDKKRKLFLPASSQTLPLNASKERIAQVMGNAFLENAFPVIAQQQRMRLQALCSFPSHHTNRSAKQFLFINRRPVQDRTLASVVRVAYGDSVPARRFPLFVAFLDAPRREVDVNVHPSKTEVRFRDPQSVRAFLMASVKTALEKNARHKKNIATMLGDIAETQPLTAPPLTATSLAPTSLAPTSFASPPFASSPPSSTFASSSSLPSEQADFSSSAEQPSPSPSPSLSPSSLPPPSVSRAGNPEPPSSESDSFFPPPSPVPNPLATNDGNSVLESFSDLPLGIAKACVHKNYIVAQTHDGITIVDAHAAHERLLFEALKRNYAERSIPVQKLLIPEIVPLPPSEIELLQTQDEKLKQEAQSFGFFFEPFDDSNVSLREMPAMLKSSRAAEMVVDLCALLRESSRDAESLLSQAIVDKILSRIACHAAVRSQKNLDAEEMNALLRKIEKEPKAAQCNHGRPTTVAFSLKDLEKLFERT